MKPSRTCVAAALLVAACSRQSATSPTTTVPDRQPIVDQTFMPTTDGIGNILSSVDSLVQSFTVNTTGSLTAVDLVAFGSRADFLIDGCTQGIELTVEVWTFSGDNAPLSSLLGSGTLVLPLERGSTTRTLADLMAAIKHVVFGQPIRVTQGQVLTLSTLNSAPSRCGSVWGFGLQIQPSTYAGGMFYTWSTDQAGRHYFPLPYADWYFRTYVVPA